MIDTKRIFAGLLCATLVAACGGSATEETTTTAPAAPVVTVAEATTSSTVAIETTVAPSVDEPTTTTVVGSPDDLDHIRLAMAATADSAPALIEGSLRMRGLVTEMGTMDVEMPMSIRTDTATGNSAMVMDMGAMAAGMSEEEGMADLVELMGSMEIRQIGEVVYLKYPLMAMLMGAGTEWISMPAEDSDLAQDLSPGGTPSDPAGMLDSFTSLEGSVEVVGTENVRGVDTTRYRLLADDAWRQSLTPHELEDLESQGFSTDEAFPLDLWIDDDGLVHRMAMEIESDGAGDGEFQSMTMTFDFSGFGESVVIEAPPPGDVTDISELSGFFDF